MACGITLKRPYSMLPYESPTGPLIQPLAKRRCAFDVTKACSPPSQPLELQFFTLAECSPLKAIPPTSRDQLRADIEGEIRKLRRRRKYFESREEKQEDKLSTLNTPTKLPSTPTRQTPSSPLPATPRRPAEQPIFTANQVVLICERELKKREDELREVFDRILNQRLTEQYDSFVRFTEEQNRKKFSDSDCSYIS